MPLAKTMLPIQWKWHQSEQHICLNQEELKRKFQRRLSDFDGAFFMTFLLCPYAISVTPELPYYFSFIRDFL